MKKHSSQALIGALALILGCVIFLTALIGLTTANSRVVVTDADRLRKAESCERTLANLHKLVVPQIDDVVAYYHQRAAQAEDEALRQRYAEREALFSGLYDELSDNKPLSDETHNTLYRMQSIDGTDFEVTPLNNLQNTLNLLIKSQNQAAAARAAITTDEATLREQLSQSDDAQQAKAAPSPVTPFSGGFSRCHICFQRQPGPGAAARPNTGAPAPAVPLQHHRRLPQHRR